MSNLILISATAGITALILYLLPILISKRLSKAFAQDTKRIAEQSVLLQKTIEEYGNKNDKLVRTYLESIDKALTKIDEGLKLIKERENELVKEIAKGNINISAYLKAIAELKNNDKHN